jgi:capsular polysaccharide biosynthesis protein
LKKQLELAKIEEIKNIPIINILDVARPPTHKSRPKRATNAATMFLLTFIGTSGYFVVRQKYGDKLSRLFGGVKRGNR